MATGNRCLVRDTRTNNEIIIPITAVFCEDNAGNLINARIEDVDEKELFMKSASNEKIKIEMIVYGETKAHLLNVERRSGGNGKRRRIAKIHSFTSGPVKPKKNCTEDQKADAKKKLLKKAVSKSITDADAEVVRKYTETSAETIGEPEAAVADARQVETFTDDNHQEQGTDSQLNEQVKIPLAPLNLPLLSASGAPSHDIKRPSSFSSQTPSKRNLFLPHSKPLSPDHSQSGSGSHKKICSRSKTRSRSRGRTRSRSRTKTRSPSRRRTPSGSRTRTRSPSRTKTRSPSRRRTPSRSRTKARSRSQTKTRSPSRNRTRSRSRTKTRSLSRRRTRSRSRTRTCSRSRSRTDSQSCATSPSVFCTTRRPSDATVDAISEPSAESDEPGPLNRKTFRDDLLALRDSIVRKLKRFVKGKNNSRPSTDGTAEIIDGVHVDVSHLMKSVEVKKMRLRANHVMRAYWPENIRRILNIRREKKRSNKRTVTSAELKDLADICNVLQRTKGLPDRHENDPKLNMRQWVRAFLKNKHRRLAKLHDTDRDHESDDSGGDVGDKGGGSEGRNE